MPDSSCNFTLRRCTAADLPVILKMQEETLADLPDKEILRHNTAAMLAGCLEAPHITVGADCDGALAAFSVLYFPKDTAEDLAGLLETVDAAGKKCANYKLCIVGKAYRGNGLQYRLEQVLEEYAVAAGVQLLCTTVSPKNPYSIHNVLRLGYTFDHTLVKYGFTRNLYYKFL